MSGPENSPVHDLTDTLQRRADDFARLGGHDLDLAQVVSRAGEIKRGRRMRASIVMAAVLVAIAVPVGISTLSDDSAKPKPPTPLSTTAPNHGQIILQDLDRGALPKDGVLLDGAWQRPGQSQSIAYGDQLAQAAYRLGNGVLVVLSDSNGNNTVHFVDPDEPNAQPQSWPIDGEVAVNADATVAAFVQPDGTVMAFQDNGARYFPVATISHALGFTAVQLTGDNCSGRSEVPSCDILVSGQTNTDQKTWLVRPNLAPVLVYPEFHRFIGTTADGLAGGTISESGDGSCGAVQDASGKTLWQTCDHTLVAFSPGGDYVLATSAYQDGPGDRELTVLNARTGATVLDLKAAQSAYLTRLYWEDASHVLAVVDGGDAAIQRIALDGNRTNAVPITAYPGQGGSPFIPVLR